MVAALAAGLGQDVPAAELGAARGHLYSLDTVEVSPW